MSRTCGYTYPFVLKQSRSKNFGNGVEKGKKRPEEDAATSKNKNKGTVRHSTGYLPYVSQLIVL